LSRSDEPKYNKINGDNSFGAIRNRQVISSSPIVGSIVNHRNPAHTTSSNPLHIASLGTLGATEVRPALLKRFDFQSKLSWLSFRPSDQESRVNQGDAGWAC
jgi:hypothetical protein